MMRSWSDQRHHTTKMHLAEVNLVTLGETSHLSLSYKHPRSKHVTLYNLKVMHHKISKGQNASHDVKNTHYTCIINIETGRQMK